MRSQEEAKAKVVQAVESSLVLLHDAAKHHGQLLPTRNWDELCEAVAELDLLKQLLKAGVEG